MNMHIGASNAALDLYLRTWRCGEGELRVKGMSLRRCCTGESERNPVLSRIAALQMGHIVVGMAGRGVVLMSREPVAMLRMIVIAVDVRVQQRRHAGRRHQRRDEQQRQHSHETSL